MSAPAPAEPTAKSRPAASSRPLLTSRQEAFCHAMAGGVGGAEAARQAGYSGNGAKQRGSFLMRQPEIRVRIDEIRAARRADHQARLDHADRQVARIIEDALETKRLGVALRAVEFGLKLCGVIQDKRIAHHYNGCLDSRPHPDADLEQLAADPEEELDPLRFRPGPTREPVAEDAGDAAMMTDDDLSAPSVPSTPAELPAPAPAQPAEPAPQASPEPGASRSAAARPAAPSGRMTDDDLARELQLLTSDLSALLCSTSLVGSVPAFGPSPGIISGAKPGGAHPTLRALAAAGPSLADSLCG